MSGSPLIWSTAMFMGVTFKDSIEVSVNQNAAARVLT